MSRRIQTLSMSKYRSCHHTPDPKCSGLDDNHITPTCGEKFPEHSGEVNSQNTRGASDRFGQSSPYDHTVYGVVFSARSELGVQNSRVAIAVLRALRHISSQSRTLHGMGTATKPQSRAGLASRQPSRLSFYHHDSQLSP